MSLDLLALGAHPDDVEICCGGWLSLAALRGQRAAVVDLTRGELATNGTPEQRAREAAEAAAVLGLALRENLALPDGGLRADDAEQIAAVVGALRRHRPKLLLAPWTEARHPDHGAAGQLALQAVFFSGLVRYRPDLGEPWRPLRLIAYPERHDGRADFVVDVSAVYEQKWAAIQCHRSQLGHGSQQGSVARETLLTGALGLQAFEVRDRYWGATIGTSHGEPYLLGAPVPLSDPVAHFVAHPASPVLVPR